MTDHPAHVGRRPPHFTGVHVIDVFHGPFQRDQMTTVVPHYALGDASGARGIQDIQWICGQNWYAVGWLRAVHDIVPVIISTCDQICHFHIALQNHARIRFVACHINGPVQQWLVWHHPAWFDAARGRDDDFGQGIVDAGS